MPARSVEKVTIPTVGMTLLTDEVAVIVHDTGMPPPAPPEFPPEPAPLPAAPPGLPAPAAAPEPALPPAALPPLPAAGTPAAPLAFAPPLPAAPPVTGLAPAPSLNGLTFSPHEDKAAIRMDPETT